MNQPIIESMSKECPHCPTRRECACPDGPEKCPDNPACPCDKTVCPCAKHRRHPEPPGCGRRMMAMGLGGAALVAALVVIIVLITRGGGSDGDPTLEISSATTTTAAVTPAPPVTTVAAVTDPTPPTESTQAPAPPTTGATTTSTTVAPRPGFVPPPIGDDVIDEVNQLFLGSAVISSDDCIVATANMQQVDQTGGSPLTDPSLAVDAYCLRRVQLDGSQVPMFNGDFLVAATVHRAPLDPTINIAYQPGIGFDRLGFDNAPGQPSGEGLVQVPIDVMGFAIQSEGWQEAQFLDLPGFAPSDLYGYAFWQPGSRVTGFAIPSDLVPPDTLVFLQSFGRQTAPGNSPASADPAASTLVFPGPAPCTGPCLIPNDRFRVTAEWASDPGTEVAGYEEPAGSFWFFSPDNVELVVRVLDACDTPGFNSFWVFAGGLTNVEVSIDVVDTQSGNQRVYDNHILSASEVITDTAAFATCP